MSTETKARNKRFVQLAVTTALATTALTACTGQVAPSHAYSAAHAEKALAKGKISKGVQHAEAAVLANPRDAYTRTLLGNAYLEDGRFTSATATFAEAIELGDTAARTIISYTLAQIAVGDQPGALDTLQRFEATLDPADFGLAIALAGRPDYGVHVLSNALRGGQNTPKVRQNLAYAYALQGNWRAARIMAAEDVPAGEVGDRMAEWAAMIHPEAFTLRVTSLLGVQPQVDPGQPKMLALANHPSIDMLAAATVEEPVVETPESDFAFAAELPAIDPTPATYDSADAALADAGLTPSNGGVRFVSNEVVQSTPAKASKPVVSPTSGNSARAAASLVRGGNYNVQLGSYFSMSDANEAWKQFQKRYPELGDAERVITKARVNGKIYYRVAAAGFAKASAQSMCRTVKGKGGGCIAYASNRPLPGAIDVIDNDVRVAAR
ncbi:SPOR domain-containing protein [Qipengyuania qiaonensis]|uniref:SPOR domain-containing protein n=1 Tax=Qipengyuania qiaonensis TaxID=2867240 RepID=A0ABS7J765_9SPHN|nr:SPOR domain-containing protein [Qipengyuania qiaonensis]MBX7483159.1 SPOR domain-containing protein [Qipengyuania qiaonensis]